MKVSPIVVSLLALLQWGCPSSCADVDIDARQGNFAEQQPEGTPGYQQPPAPPAAATPPPQGGFVPGGQQPGYEQPPMQATPAPGQEGSPQGFYETMPDAADVGAAHQEQDAGPDSSTDATVATPDVASSDADYVPPWISPDEDAGDEDGGVDASADAPGALDSMPDGNAA